MQIKMALICLAMGGCADIGQAGEDGEKLAATTETTSPAFRIDWVNEIGPAGSNQGVSLVAAGAGRGFIAGTWTRFVQFPDGPTYRSGTDQDFPSFLAGVSPTGAILWKRLFGGEESFLIDLYVTPGNDAITVILPPSSGDVGCGPARPNVLMVVEYDGATGHCTWMRSLSGARFVRLRPLPSGDFIVAGDFVLSLDLGGGHILNSSGNALFVARLDARGHTRWARVVGEQPVNTFGPLSASSLATDPTGAFFITGSFSGVVTLGGQTVGTDGINSSFVMGLDPEGNARWRYVPDSIGAFFPIDQRGGRLAVVGRAGQSPFTFAGTEHPVAGDWTGVVLAFGRDGHQRWAQTFPGYDISAVTVDDAGHVHAAGDTVTEGQITLGTITIESNAFLTVLDSESGFPLRANPIGNDTDFCAVSSLSFGPGGFRLMGGTYAGGCHLDPFVLSSDAFNGNGFYGSLIK